MANTKSNANGSDAIQPRLAAAGEMADRWVEIAAQLSALTAAIVAARPAAGSYRDLAAWERDRQIVDRRLELISQLERRFSTEAARMAAAR